MLTVSLYQPYCEPSLDGVAARLKKLKEKAREAVGKGADILVCPELYLSGYNIGDGVQTSAIALGDDVINEIKAIAGDNNIAIFCGYPEKMGEDIYNALLCVSSSGDILASYKKQNLVGDYENTYFSKGTQDTVVSVKGWNIGVLICYDVEFPETTRRLAQSGADLIIVPTALGDAWSFVSEKLIPVRAFENGLYVAYANYAGREGDMKYLGGSRVEGPEGKNYALAGDGEELIFAELDKSAITKIRKRLPYLENLKRGTL